MYTPAAVIVPPAAPSWTLQVTEVSVAPVTVAENVSVVQASAVTGDGVTVTTTGAGRAVTVTVAASDLDGSARLVATTMQVEAVAGAV